MIRKLTLREIKKSLARYLAIFAIVALGVGFFSGLQMCKPDMIETGRQFVDKNDLYDYEITTSYGIDKKSIKIAKKNENVVTVEGSIQQDIAVKTTGEEKVLKAISLPQDINKIELTDGRMPQNKNECLIDKKQFNQEDFKIGKTLELGVGSKKKNAIKLKTKKLKIVGAATTPLYLDHERGTTTLGDGTIFAYIYLPKVAFDTRLYTTMYLKLRGNEAAFTEEYDNKIDEKEDLMKDLADKIRADRYNTVREKAQRKVDDAKQEYQDGLNKYNSEKSCAEREIREAENQIKAAKMQINNGKKNLRDMIKHLKVKKSEVIAGMRLCKNSLHDLEKSQLEGIIDDNAYKLMKNQLKKKIISLEKKSVQIKEGIVEARDTLRMLPAMRKKIEKQSEKLKRSKVKAEAEFRKAKAKLDDAKSKIDKAQNKIDNLDKGKSCALTRDTNMGYATFEENSNIVSNIAKVFPLFFFLIAALVCMTTMTRMVDEQRSQIGVLKALGYSNSLILSKYMFYSGSAALGGSLFGLLVGCKVFPSVIWHAYTMMYNFSDQVEFLINWKLAVICVLVAMFCCMGATWASCASDFRVIPAELIRPKTPKAGKRILLERIKSIWTRLSFLYKVSFRNIFRYKKRFFMMVIGVSGCTALLIAGLGINTTIKGIAERQYDEVLKYDYQMTFDQNMSKDKQADFADFAKEKGVSADEILFVHSSNIDMKYRDKTEQVALTATDDKRITQFINFTDKSKRIKYPRDGEIIICKKLHEQRGINVGDEVVLKKGYDEVLVRVSGMFDNYMWEPIYMNEKTYREGFGKNAEKKTAFIKLGDKKSLENNRDLSLKLSKHKHALQTSISQDFIERIDDMMKSLNAVVYVVILCAGLLAFIVLYNLTNINITERIREIATIKVLGFNQSETSQYVFRENIFLTAVAVVVGVPLGKLLLKFVVDNININMVYFVPRITAIDYVLAVILTFVFAFVVNFAMRRRLRKVSMTESLKSIE